MESLNKDLRFLPPQDSNNEVKRWVTNSVGYQCAISLVYSNKTLKHQGVIYLLFGSLFR